MKLRPPLPVINVNELGRDAEGNDFNTYAANWAVKQGLMTNRPVQLRYPDGHMRKANQVKITSKGLERLNRAIPVSLRDQGGNA